MSSPCVASFVAGIGSAGAKPAPAARPEPLDLASVNAATVGDPAAPSRALLVRVAILLDRARVSPGAIDGRGGDNLDKAVRAYRQANGLGDETRRSTRRRLPN